MPRRAWLIVSSSNCQSLLREKRKRASDFVILLLPLFALSVFPYIVLLLALRSFFLSLFFIILLFFFFSFILHSPLHHFSISRFCSCLPSALTTSSYFLFYSSLFSYFILVLLDDLFSIFSFSLFVVSIESMLSSIALKIKLSCISCYSQALPRRGAERMRCRMLRI